MSKKFVLTGDQEGKTFILNDRYSFVNGEMPCSDDDARNIKPILCGYHACDLVDVADTAVTEDDDEKDDVSLKKANTK